MSVFKLTVEIFIHNFVLLNTKKLIPFSVVNFYTVIQILKVQ
jgi:hypothetical protein